MTLPEVPYDEPDISEGVDESMSTSLAPLETSPRVAWCRPHNDASNRGSYLCAGLDEGTGRKRR